MKPRKGYLPEQQHFPILGLNTLVPSTMLDAGSSPNIHNMEIVKGTLSKRRGYQPIGDAFEGTPMLLTEFESSAGAKHLVLITTTKQYRYDATADAWVNITYQLDESDVNWTGAVTDVVQAVSVLGNDGKWLIFTNGKDEPRYWDGAADTTAPLSTAPGWDFPGFVTCKTLATFYDHLIMGNVTTASQEKFSVYWSDVLSLTQWTSGTSGNALLTDSMGQIVRLEKLGDRLIIYCENSISMMSYIGGEIIYSFEELIRETQLLSPRSIINLGSVHLYMSLENIYLFDGSRQKTPIADVIHKTLREELYLSQRHFAFAYNDGPKSAIFWLVPTGDSTSVVYKQEYDVFNLRESHWTRLEYADRPTSMAYFSRDSTLLWNSAAIASLTWENADFTWRQASVRSGYPTRVFSGTTKVLISDETITNDDGETIESFWDSKDFTIPEEYQSELGRWIEIELELRGFEVEVFISIDGGQTFTTVEHLNLTPQWKHYRVLTDKVSRLFRIRLVNNCVNSNFEYRWHKVWFRPAGAR